MRVIFVGSTSLGLEVLKSVRSVTGVQIVGCISSPATFSISYSTSPIVNVLHADLESYCDAAGIPVYLTSTGARDAQVLEWLSALRPDAFLVVGWYHMIPQAWRDLAPAYGLHASLLPDLAGGAPLVWAMILGRQMTGVTLFQMDDGVDTGDIVGQRAFPIHPRDTIADLLNRTEDAAIEMVPNAMSRLASGDLTPVPQAESGRVVMPQRRPEDGEINWERPVKEIDVLIRAVTRPYPGAFADFGDRRLRIWSATPRATSKGEMPPGTLVEHNGAMSIACQDDFLEVVEFDWEGLSTRPG